MIRLASTSFSVERGKHAPNNKVASGNVHITRSRGRCIATRANAGQQQHNDDNEPATVEITAREGGVAINVTGGTDGLVRVAGYLSALAALAPAARGKGGGGAPAAAAAFNGGDVTTTAADKIAPLPPPTPPKAVPPAAAPPPPHLEPCTLDGATHILWGGVLQPLVWRRERGGGGTSDDDDDEDDDSVCFESVCFSSDGSGDEFDAFKSMRTAPDDLPYIDIYQDATLARTAESVLKPVTLDVLRRAPLLRLPSDAGALTALLAAGAVPGVTLAGVGPPRPGGRSGREYALCYGALRPLYGPPVSRAGRAGDFSDGDDDNEGAREAILPRARAAVAGCLLPVAHSEARYYLRCQATPKRDE